MTLTQSTHAGAERTIVLSIPEARKLPGVLGRICPAMLTAHGYYAVTVDGVKTLYVLAGGRDAS